MRWRRRCTQVSIVSQEPVLFAESILYNICFGMPRGVEGVSREQVRADTFSRTLQSGHSRVVAVDALYL
jgi:ABC-type transport system involved in cytochrome bd biosynthesis fused ATPase/permease subunit